MIGHDTVEATIPTAGRLTAAEVFRVVSLVAFLNVGLFKGDPHLAHIPVDLTVVFAALVLVELLVALQRNRGRIPWSAGIILLLFALFLPGVLWTTWWPYALDKTIRFFSLTLLAAVAPVYLVTTARAFRAFAIGFLVVGIILCVSAGLSLLGGEEGLLRLSALGAATIAFSRAAGSAFLVVLYLRARRELGSMLAVSLGSLLLLAMIGSGSRGPLLSLIPAVGAFGFVVARPKLFSVIKVGSIAGAALLAWGWIEPYLPIAPLKRLTAFAHGHLGSSELERLNAFRASADVIPSHPFGLGLGGFQGLNVLVGSPRQFPHNIILEAWLEGGWAAGTVLVAVLCIALVRLGFLARLRRLRPESGVLIALFVFLLLNDLVSGELNDSKVFFSVLALTLSFPGAFARNGVQANSGRFVEGAYAPNIEPS